MTIKKIIMTQNPKFHIPRKGYSLVYNHQTKKINFFGGIDPIQKRFHNDLWELNQNGWEKIPFEGNTPPARAFSGIIFDKQSSKLLLYGGMGETGNVLEDTWIFNGLGWEKIDTELSSFPRLGFSMAYDSANDKVVLFGGIIRNGRQHKPLNDTWIWNGANWDYKPTKISPSKRGTSGMIYSPIENCVLLMGGSTDWQRFDDTWLWDGTSWEMQTETPYKLDSVGKSILSFDKKKNALLLIGKKPNETNISAWIHDGEKWSDKPLKKTYQTNSGYTFSQIVYHPEWETTILFSTTQIRKMGGKSVNDEGIEIVTEAFTIE